MRYMMIALVALSMACCGWGNSDAVARAGLNMLAATVGPASKLASQGCDAKEQLEIALVKSGVNSSIVAEQRLRQTRARCDALNETFALIRKLHEEAATFVEAGKLKEAQLRLDDARAQYQAVLKDLEEP
jgi:hypothetical protein